MTATPKHHISGQPHIQPAPRPRSKLTDIATAQKNHVNRAKPATIPTPPWESAETPCPDATEQNN